MSIAAHAGYQGNGILLRERRQYDPLVVVANRFQKTGCRNRARSIACVDELPYVRQQCAGRRRPSLVKTIDYEVNPRSGGINAENPQRIVNRTLKPSARISRTQPYRDQLLRISKGLLDSGLMQTLTS